MSLTILATVATLITGSPCAAIDNGPNAAAFAAPGHVATATTYSDEGEHLVYADAPGPLDDGQWIALHAAEAGLQHGPAGRKVRLACS